MEQFTPFLQIILALFLGLVLGIERLIAGRVAGPRTYGLVSVGACLLTLLSQYASEHYAAPIDPMHVLAAIVTGVGFIGAGLIVLHGSKLSGLTTAAGIWVAAAIGISVGLQVYPIAVFVTFLTLFVFSVLSRFERKFKLMFAEKNGRE